MHLSLKPPEDGFWSQALAQLMQQDRADGSSCSSTSGTEALHDVQAISFPLPRLQLVVCVRQERAPARRREEYRIDLRSVPASGSLVDAPAIAPADQPRQWGLEDAIRDEPDAPPPSPTRSDPVIEELARALDEAENSSEPNAEIYADAVRLAITARLAGVRSTYADAAGAGRGKGSLPKWRLKRVKAYVDENLAEKLSLADLAAVAGLGRMHFAAQFREATGLRPHEYVLRRRISRACEMLLEAERSIVDIALSVGFQTQAHFTTVFKRFVGETPHRWRTTRFDY